MSIVRKSFLLFVVVIASAKVWGQAAQSPYSTYGIGEAYGNALIHNQGMGGVGVSQPQFWFLNNQNPALLVYNTITVFEAGLLAESRKLKTDTLTEKTRAGNMTYLATAFPIKPGKWTTSVGLMPYTNVDFAFSSESVRNDGGQSTKYYELEQGLGGLTQLYWSNGVRLSRSMSIGLKASYLFGSIENTYSGRIETSNYITALSEKSVASDFRFGLGYSFSKDSIGRKNLRFSAGAVYEFESNLKSKRTDKFYTLNAAGDTISSEELNNVPGNIFIPASVTVGISISRGLKWSAGAEFHYQDWQSFKSVNPDDEGLQESWRASVGGELTPDPTSLDKYLKRITYRAGLVLEQYPFLPNGNKIRDFGFTAGLSLPAGKSSLDVAVKTGRRGSIDKNLIAESYFKIYFGITFNDQWFIKRKFD